MHTIPVPCVNCTRFHYRPCRDPPKDCWACGMFGHIERFCPQRRIWTDIDRDAPLPGTNRWCEMFGLDQDPELRRRVLFALKASPGSSITVNERKRDYRSRSPSRGRNPYKRSRSPLRRYSRDNRREFGHDYREYRGRSRSRTPYSRAASPYRGRYRSTSSRRLNVRSRSPMRKENDRALCQPNFLSQMQKVKPSNPNRIPLGQVSTNLPRHELTSNSAQVDPGPQASPVVDDTSANKDAPILPGVDPDQTNSDGTLQATPEVDMLVNDPRFVLGVGEGAMEAEILEAFRQRMWEVELERMADSSYRHESSNERDDPDVFDESVKILKAAKKQLVGY